MKRIKVLKATVYILEMMCYNILLTEVPKFAFIRKEMKRKKIHGVEE